METPCVRTRQGARGRGGTWGGGRATCEYLPGPGPAGRVKRGPSGPALTCVCHLSTRCLPRLPSLCRPRRRAVSARPSAAPHKVGAVRAIVLGNETTDTRTSSCSRPDTWTYLRIRPMEIEMRGFQMQINLSQRDLSNLSLKDLFAFVSPAVSADPATRHACSVLTTPRRHATPERCNRFSDRRVAESRSRPAHPSRTTPPVHTRPLAPRRPNMAAIHRSAQARLDVTRRALRAGEGGS